MKLLLIGELSWSYVVGSSTQKVQRNIFEELKKNKYDVTFYEITPSDSFVDRLFKKIKFSEDKVITGGVIRIWFRILKSEYEIVHLLVLRNYMLLFLPLILGSPKFVILVHDTLSLRGLTPKKLNHMVRVLFMKFAHAVLVFNHSDQKLLTKFRKDVDTISVVKQGIKLDSNEQIKINTSDTPVILFPGGIGKDYKGLRFLRLALMQVKEKYKLLLCGTNYTAEAERDYYGALNEKEYYEILQRSRVVVVPSIYESFSLVALEALANGVPVILTKNCGITEYLDNGNGCFIIEYDNVMDFANKIALLLKDKMTWENMSRDALIVSKEFHWSNVIKTYTNIYSLLLNGPK
jgi:glycosyltransferase involved in cell wall biosynthesis